MAAGYFSFYMKHYVNILRDVAWEPSAVYLEPYEIRTTKETQMLSDTDILKIIYSHVLVFVQKQLIKYFPVCLQEMSLKMTWEKQLLINFNTVSIMLIKF